ncbi:MAG: FeoB-associated Cys-rich membrane protein [Clostridiales bacterium]|nr:FeoB-associated Cys-rich membrane protein [Clostridiales bacterium]
MGTAIIVIILVAACAYGVYSYVKKLKKGGGCCGEHEETVKKVRVADRDKSHYPYRAVVRIEGMTCSNCASRVQNALNAMEGTWAEVDLGDRRAALRLKQPPDEAAIRKTVNALGYTVLSVRAEE